MNAEKVGLAAAVIIALCILAFIAGLNGGIHLGF